MNTATVEIERLDTTIEQTCRLTGKRRSDFDAYLVGWIQQTLSRGDLMDLAEYKLAVMTFANSALRTALRTAPTGNRA